MSVVMEYETITSKMYPITPVELGAGFLIGKERILTRRSGLFGWGDDSEAEVFFYDQNGKPTAELEAPERIVPGRSRHAFRPAKKSKIFLSGAYYVGLRRVYGSG